MSHQFPRIENISQVREVLENQELFSIIDNGWYSYVCYIAAHAFTEVENHPQYALFKEFRGLIFDNETGNILSRPHPKFFNVNEKTETQLANLPKTPFRVPLKEDGSMIHTFRNPRTNVIHYATKRGETDTSGIAKKFIENNKDYQNFFHHCADNGWTPIFELIHPSNRIVIDYGDRAELVLTSVRDIITGENKDYQTLAARFNISAVEEIEVKDIADLINHVKEGTGIEGYILDFDGYKVKIKSDWYFQRSRIFGGMFLDIHLAQIVHDDQSDDVKAWLPVHKERIERMEKFYRDYVSAFRNNATSIWEKLGKPSARELSTSENKKLFSPPELTYVLALANGKDANATHDRYIQIKAINTRPLFTEFVEHVKERYGIEFVQEAP